MTLVFHMLQGKTPWNSPSPIPSAIKNSLSQNSLST